MNLNANLISGAVYNWGYNLLSELDENAIVFVCGGNDTYSLCGLQSVKKFRPDVSALHTSLILVDDYHIRKLKARGIESEDIRMDDASSTEDFIQRQKELFDRIWTNFKLSVYFSSKAVSQL